MKFENIPELLSEYSFTYKMAISQNLSREIMTINGLIDIEDLREKVLPWEIETFALLSILPEKKENIFQNMSEKVYLEIIEAIRNFEHPKLIEAAENKEFADYFMIVTGLTQFSLQENIYFKYFRYNFFFNFENDLINMKNIFDKKFKMNFGRVRRFGLILNLLFCYKSENGKVPDATNILKYLGSEYDDVFKLFTLNRNEFVKFQGKIINRIEQYIYGFRYFYQYPFIEENGLIYMPLPHLINTATNSSLLFRLTESNTSLREKFGKEVLENYLFEVCSVNRKNRQILSEYVYDEKKNLRTIDLMLDFDECALLLDSKSFVPRISLRDLSDEEIEYSTKIIIKSIKQMYVHIKERFNISYFPFGRDKQFELNNVFGIVVIAEDNFIRRGYIMKEAAIELDIDIASKEFDFLCSNIKVLSLYNIEDMFLYHKDIIKLLKYNQANKDTWFNYTLSNDTDDQSELDVKILNCENEIKYLYMDIIKELQDNGLINT